MNEIVKKPELRAGQPVAPIIPRTVDEVGRVAAAVITAGLSPASYEGKTPKETQSKIMIGIMKGAEVGLPPITALSTIAIINGRPCLWGDGAMALIQQSGKLEWIREWFEGDPGTDNWTAHCEMKRRDQDEPYKGSFSVADATRAKLWNNPKKSPWMMYPQRMLRWRAFSWPARDGFADVLSGLSIAEEAQDLPQAPESVDTGFLDDSPQQIEHAPESGADEATAEATVAEEYVARLLQDIADCETEEALDALGAESEPHLSACEPDDVVRIAEAFAARRAEMKSLER